MLFNRGKVLLHGGMGEVRRECILLVREGGNTNVALFSDAGRLATDLTILKHGQVTRMTPELAPALSKLSHHTNGRTLEPRLI
ncbi:hypothetical protein TNCV_3450241 [Trichonephila clavipes]|uniref:Uncharacterized protein n=1 Tax=Trichonephila clavipes TaxID=2585209 RepID=A0A8X6WLP3_TRICX|nr:hypothetical protein TNCV_3450241 [Trichonephila clavipes]